MLCFRHSTVVQMLAGTSNLIGAVLLALSTCPAHGYRGTPLSLHTVDPKDNPAGFQAIRARTLLQSTPNDVGCEGRGYGTHPDSTDVHCYLFCPGQFTPGDTTILDSKGLPEAHNDAPAYGNRVCCMNVLCYQHPEDGRPIGECGACGSVPG
jgi:hypothetical protein